MRQISLAVLPCLVAACATSDAEPNDTTAGAAMAGGDVAVEGAAVAPTGDAAITGTVRLAGTPPPNPVIDMSAEPGCAAMYGGGKPTDFVVDGRDGALANVFVYVKRGLPEPHRYPVPDRPVLVSQDECRLKPRVVGIMAGQSLEILNSDTVPLAVAAAPRRSDGFSLALAGNGDTAQRRFAAPEIMVPLTSPRHGWLRAYVGVVDHPFFTSTGSDGSFRIEGLPPGTYEVEAWHERFGTRSAVVRVPAEGAATTQLTFTAPPQS